MNDKSCFSSDQLFEYARCSCTEEQSQQIESHLQQCETCQTQFALVVDAGAEPSFIRLGQKLIKEPGPTLAVTTEQIAGDSTIVPFSSRNIPETIGQYRVTGYLGGGGMGVVYAAWDELLKRPVALKLLRHHTEHGSRSMRMLQEAAALGRLSHPNIVSIYEVLSHDSQPVLSMELVEGQNLAKWLDGRRVDPKLAAELVLKLASALHYAHSKGVVHRDLKPANVMLEIVPTQNATLNDLASLVPKITDFGLAKLVDETAMTNTGDVLGTPGYMSPEQAFGASGEVGPSVDLYALGIILYELLTGRPPFIAESILQTLDLVKNAIPVAPHILNASVPRDLDTICRKCLEKRPLDRYANVALLADDLGAFLEGRPVKARPIGALAQGLRWAVRNRAIATMLAACSLLLVAIAIGSFVFASREYYRSAELLKKEQEKEATRIEGLVGRLKSADPAKVSEIIEELHKDFEAAAIYEAPLVSAEAKTIDEKRAQLHARLAMVARDKSLVEPLLEELLTAKVAYIGPIRQQLRPYAGELIERLRAILHDENVESERRFHAAMALADYVPALEASSWTEKDLQFVAFQLVGANPEFQPTMRENLRPISKLLFPALEKIFVPPVASYLIDPITDAERKGAANAFADFAADDIATLSKLLTIATPEQYAVLFPSVSAARAPSMVEDYAKLIATLPPAELDSLEGVYSPRVAYAQRRAGAAVTLLRLGEREKILPLFDVTDDPEALTQFILRCRERGVRITELLDCLRLVSESPTNRFPSSSRYALLLALSRYRIHEIPESQQEALFKHLGDLYLNDPSSGTHSASRYLLQRWGQFDLLDQVEQTPIPYSVDREWFNLAISVPSIPDESKPEPAKTFYYTFVVFPSGTFQVGLSNNQIDNARHTVTLTRPFALLDREITIDELIAFRAEYEKRSSGPRSPGIVKSWYDAVAFCRWLSECNGITESDQSYAAPELLDTDQYPRETSLGAEWAPRDWPLELRRRGFRLPTESEWEIACIDGAKTHFSFGSDWPTLREFDWYQENSLGHAPRALMPTRRGLYDVHGSLQEWTHDWHAVFKDGDLLVDPLGPERGTQRTQRGGSNSLDAHRCRPTSRDSNAPAAVKGLSGFRIALSLPEPSQPEPAPKEAGKE